MIIARSNFNTYHSVWTCFYLFYFYCIKPGSLAFIFLHPSNPFNQKTLIERKSHSLCFCRKPQWQWSDNSLHSYLETTDKRQSWCYYYGGALVICTLTTLNMLQILYFTLSIWAYTYVLSWIISYKIPNRSTSILYIFIYFIYFIIFIYF